MLIVSKFLGKSRREHIHDLLERTKILFNEAVEKNLVGCQRTHKKGFFCIVAYVIFKTRILSNFLF